MVPLVNGIAKANFVMDPIVRIGINSGFTDSPFQPPFAVSVLEETPEHRTYVGADGITRKEFRQHADTSMPQFMRFPVTDRADWHAVLKRLSPADAPARIGDVARLQAACGSPDVPTMLPICGAFGHPRNLFGDEGLAFAMYDDPALLEEVLDNWLELYEQLLRRLTEAIRVEVLLIWEDMCYKNGPLISPRHVRQLMLPRYSQLIGVARACGVQAIIVDTDSDCLKLIPLFLEVDVDALMPFEAQAGMDVTAIGKEFPNLGIMGGIDKRPLSGDRAAIRREVERVVPAFRERGCFIPCLDHAVPPNVPLANFQYYLECVRRYES